MTDQTRWRIPEVHLKNKLIKKGIIMEEDRGDLDLTKQIEKLQKKVGELEGELSIVKGIGMNSPEMKAANKTIVTLRQRINELMAINKSHQQLMGKQIVENEELKKDNKALAKQIDDYFHVRMTNTRNSGM